MESVGQLIISMNELKRRVIPERTKSVITYSALFPAAYAAMPETKAAEYIAPDSITMIMTGKRVEDMPACFSSRWLRQILKAMSPSGDSVS